MAGMVFRLMFSRDGIFPKLIESHMHLLQLSFTAKSLADPALAWVARNGK